MITSENYYTQIKSTDLSKLPEALQKGREFVDKVTEHGKSWKIYNSSDAIRKVINTYFEKLSEFIGTNSPKAVAVRNSKPKAEAKRVTKGKPSKAVEVQDKDIHFQERIPEEIRFIRRFVLLNGKTKSKEQLLTFINSLQKAIVEKRIRKTSKWAKQIKSIQEKLIETYNSVKSSVTIELKPETINSLKKFVGQEKLLNSIAIIKRYIGINGKPEMKERAKNLLKSLNRSLEKEVIAANDPYFSEVTGIRKNLESFISTPSKKVLEIETATLNGLHGVLGCACNTSLSGIEPGVMNSVDFATLKFDSLGFTGKWLDLIGDPAKGFTAMVFGKPKMGKSYLCVDFAGYLARNFGKVLYVAREEKLDATLQKKLSDKNVMHPNLFVSDHLPSSLANYQFVFLDSVNKLQMSSGDLESLKSTNPGISFIYVFQSTKEGNFRGGNEFQHDVDVVVEVPERGKAVQFGRFNQGGEIQIF